MKRKQQQQQQQNNDKRRRCHTTKKQSIPMNHHLAIPSSTDHTSEEEQQLLKVQPQLQVQQQIEKVAASATTVVEKKQQVVEKVHGEDIIVAPEEGKSVKPSDMSVPVGAVASRLPSTTVAGEDERTESAIGLTSSNTLPVLDHNRTPFHTIKGTYLKPKDLNSSDKVDIASNHVDIMDFSSNSNVVDELESSMMMTTASVPSPPPFVRSVAQVIHHSLSSTTTTTNAFANLNHVDFYKHDLISDESFDPFFHFDMKIDELSTIPQDSPIAATKNTASYCSPITDDRNTLATRNHTRATTSNSTKGVSNRSKGTGTTYSNVNKILPTFRKNTKSMRFTSKQHHGSTSTLDDSCNTSDYEKVESVSKQLVNTSVEAGTLIRTKDNAILSHNIQKVAFKDTATVNNLYRSVETIPPSFIKGKMINTKYGLAMVVVPTSNVPTTEYMNTFCGSSTDNTNPLWNSTTKLSEDKVISRTSWTTAAIEQQEYKDTAPSLNGLYKHWIKAEDELLQYAVSQQTLGPPYMWKEIASSYFPNTRSAIQCKARWKKIDPQLTKSQFTADEDSIILKGQTNGLSWPDIAKQLPGRNAEQIRVRFLNAIDPSIMKNVGWTEQEEETLRKAQIAMGNKWTLIATLLPGRSPNDVKNHWHNKKLKVTRKMKSLALLNHRNEVMSNLRGAGTTVMTYSDVNQESADDADNHDATKPFAVSQV